MAVISFARTVSTLRLLGCTSFRVRFLTGRHYWIIVPSRVVMPLMVVIPERSISPTVSRFLVRSRVPDDDTSSCITGPAIRQLGCKSFRAIFPRGSKFLLSLTEPKVTAISSGFLIRRGAGHMNLLFLFFLLYPLLSSRCLPAVRATPSTAGGNCHTLCLLREAPSVHSTSYVRLTSYMLSLGGDLHLALGVGVLPPVLPVRSDVVYLYLSWDLS